ncbi:MAG: MFS transporter [Clostridia bacterium]|jgi:FSR family fosmidomycin resistance protein-like MFS transporter|nr:MFS transporter [Clostridia bacterium]
MAEIYKTESDNERGTFGVLSVAHLINDMYGNFIPQLLPFLITGGIVSVTAGATLVGAFTITSSIAQPIFGYLVDQKNQGWVIMVGTLWMSIFLGITGFVTNYGLLFLLTAAAGLGTAAFHPQASATIGQLRNTNKGFILAAFVAMGNIGTALSPVIFLNLFNSFGIHSTGFAVIPGIIAASLLYFFAPRQMKKEKNHKEMGQVINALKKPSRELSKLVLVVSLRSLVNTSFIMLLPLYFLEMNLSHKIVSSLMFATLAAGAIGGLIGGYISDKYGKRPLIAFSLFLSALFFYGFLYTTGPISILLLALGGMSLLSSFSVTVAFAQDVIPENKAMASGLSLGFAIGIGGLAVTPIGKLAELYGIEIALHLAFIIPAAAGLIALSLKDDKKAAQ